MMRCGLGGASSLGPSLLRPRPCVGAEAGPCADARLGEGPTDCRPAVLAVSIKRCACHVWKVAASTERCVAACDHEIEWRSAEVERLGEEAMV